MWPDRTIVGLPCTLSRLSCVLAEIDARLSCSEKMPQGKAPRCSVGNKLTSHCGSPVLGPRTAIKHQSRCGALWAGNRPRGYPQNPRRPRMRLLGRSYHARLSVSRRSRDRICASSSCGCTLSTAASSSWKPSSRWVIHWSVLRYASRGGQGRIEAVRRQCEP